MSRVARARQLLAVMGGSARVQAQIAAQYRANLVLWGLMRLLQTVVYIGVWRAVADANGGEAAGFTAAEFAGYFLCVLIVVELTFTWIQGRLPEMIRTGELSPKLLRPVNPLVEMFGKMASYNLGLLIVLSPSILVLWFVFDAEVEVSASTAAVTIAMLPLAAATRFLADALVAITGFWLTRVDAIRSLYTYLGLLLGGQFAPLDTLPGPMQDIARLLPFYWTLGFPVEALTGRLDAGEIAFGVVVLAGWCLVLFGLVRVAWRAGVRTYGAVGA